MYGGLLTTTSTSPSSSAKAVVGVAEHQLDVEPEVVAVADGPRVRQVGQLDRVDRGRRHLVLQAQRDRTGPGAQVDHDGGAALRSARSSSSGTARPATISVSGRGTKTPGPTDSSRWRKAARPVRCCSGTRRARSATSASHGLQPGRGLGAEDHQPAHLAGRGAQGVRGQRHGVDVGLLDAGRRELPRGRPDRLAQGAGHEAEESWATAAMRAASSASTADCTSGSSSPSSTVSRL